MLLFACAVSVVLVVSFLCSIFESVLLSVTRPQIEVMAHKRRRASQLLARFKENMDVPIAAILILNTAAHTVGAAVAGASYSNVFSANTLWIFSIIFTIAVLLFTEIIPKTLGISYATKLAAPVAHGIHWLTVLLRPLVFVSERLSRSLRRDVDIPVTSAEEIRLMASLGRSRGIFGSRAANVIVGATHLSHLRAHDVMLPREKVQFLDGTMQRNEALALMRETGFSRFPYSATGDVDDVNGIVLAKELFDWLLVHDDDDIDWQALRRDALVVPESSPLPRMLRTFQESQRHLAIISDEYGSVKGIATLEDVLEEIVGDIHDEKESPANDIVERSDGAIEVSASVDLRKLSAVLGIAWSPEDEVTSVGGLLTESLERIPAVGEFIDWRGYRLTVLRANEQRVELLAVQPLSSSR